jgi:hypothetical protein
MVAVQMPPMLKKENSLVFVVLPPMEAVFFVDLAFHHRHW